MRFSSHHLGRGRQTINRTRAIDRNSVGVEKPIVADARPSMVVILSSYCITDSVRQEFRWRPITSRVRLGSVRLSRAHRGLRSLARLPKVFARRARAISSVSVAVPHRRKNDCDETAAAECESETDFDGTVRDRPGKVDRPLPPRQRQQLQPQRSVLGENRPRRRKKIRLAPAKPLCLFWKSIRPQAGS